MAEGSKSKNVSLLNALDSIHATKVLKKFKTPIKKKVKKRKEGDGKGKDGVVKVEEEEFEYSWPVCACGMYHPPIPQFKPPNGKKCTYYWQIADAFPFLSLHRALTTEIAFMKADNNQSGVIELAELQTLLKEVCDTTISDKMIEKTFNEIDLDNSGTIDFYEVLSITFTLIQREKTNLPNVVQTNYTKACSIQ